MEIEELLDVPAMKSSTETHAKSLSNQNPAVDDHEQQQLERRGNDHWRHHHHSEAHQDDGHNKVDQNEWDVDTKAHDEGGLEFADDIGWNQHTHRCVLRS